MYDPPKASSKKISREFASRLAKLTASRRVRAIVLVDTAVQTQAAKPNSRAQRRATAATIRRSAEKALPEIDALLEKHGGERMTMPNSLGSISVETTPEGIRALAKSKRVKAILEDQHIQPVH